MDLGSGGVRIPESLAVALRDARSVAVLTGSGVSAESGVPTFREAQTGLWARFDPMRLATPEAFARDPVQVHAFYNMRRHRASCSAVSLHQLEKPQCVANRVNAADFVGIHCGDRH